ncbi:Cupredoxin-like domain protein [uncultured archaeon]|nr:Cupredoxin-like domain protein [uncultured archaeon]
MKPRTWIFICILVLILISLMAVYLVITLNGKRTLSVGTVNNALCKSKVYIVEITAIGFLPPELTIARGDTVIWKNKDSNVQELSFESLNMTAPIKLFRGQNYTYTFDHNGLYEYGCVKPSYKKGKIIVKPF